MFCDATYLKGRVRGQVVSRAVVVATGMTGNGDWEVPAWRWVNELSRHLSRPAPGAGLVR